MTFCPVALIVAVVGVVSLLPSRAHAQHAPSAIDTNNYSIEFYQGPVMAPLRVTGLAGAYTGYAEGIDGITSNSAAPGVRFPQSTSMFDYDLSLSLSLPSALRDTDFDNDGNTGFAYEDFVFLTLGAMLQWGDFGIGWLSDVQAYGITPKESSNDPSLSLIIHRADITGSWSIWNQQLIFGLGPRIVALSMSSNADAAAHEPLVDISGMAPQFGMLIRPNHAPWRIGLNYRTPVRGSIRSTHNVTVDDFGILRVFDFPIPSSVYIPWEIRAGFSLQLGPRPLNPTWVNPVAHEQRERQRILDGQRQRYANRNKQLRLIANPQERQAYEKRIDEEEVYLRHQEEIILQQVADRLQQQRDTVFSRLPRDYLLVVAEVLITGSSPDAISVESFLSRTKRRTGQDLSISPRLGLESEPIRGYLKTRLGTYVEPSRFRNHSYRQHVTFGFDLRVFRFPGWWILSPAHYRISGMTDLAPRYTNIGFSFGSWY